MPFPSVADWQKIAMHYIYLSISLVISFYANSVTLALHYSLFRATPLVYAIIN